MESSINHKRKEAMFLKVLSEIITEEVTNSDVSYPTVTAVKLSHNSSHLLAYLTFEKESEKSLAALNNAKGFIRSRLTKIPNLRRIPELSFKIDDTLERANRIEEILANIKDEKK